MNLSRITRPLRQFWRLSHPALLIPVLLLTALVWHGEAQAAHLRLSWLDNSSNEDGFQIERAIGANGMFVQIAIQGTNLNFYTDSDLVPGVTYCYRVRAFNTFGQSAYSNASCATVSTLMVALENPDNGQPVSGIAVVRGWAFDSQADRQISNTELFVDGVRIGDTPCCSARRDVQASFPQFPSQNTYNSGWGTTINWGLLSPGTHTIRVQTRNTAGEMLSTETRTVTVVRPGDFEFLDQFSLSGATTRIAGDELVVEGVVVRDKATQRQRKINTRFRWFASSQSLGMVETVTTEEIFSLRSLCSSLCSPLGAALRGLSATASAQAAPGIMAAFESPEEGQAVSGVAVVRGWAFAEPAQAAIVEVRLLIDGTPETLIPCCSARADVAALYPNTPGALDSGWGITLNYGVLTPGFHLLGVQIRTSTGDALTLNRGVTVVKLGGFEFLDQFDLSSAGSSIQGGTMIAVQGVRIRDKASQQTKTVDVLLQWVQSAQALLVVASSTVG